MIINQLKGIVLSMKAIREINPSAKLIQTEDLGKTYSTPYLHHQASFENERRWLTSDLLCGKLRPSDAMWKYFLRLGIPEDSLEFFIENPCPPDVMGFNHYVTSERYLDENLSRFPDFTHGGNEIQDYADVEAVRVHHEQPSGLKILLKEAHERVDLPIAITEAHLNCTREEQLRWLKEVWDSCIDLRNEGIPIVAVTAWSHFGAFGWNQLLTSKIMEYEPGAFDIRSGMPRPTAVAFLIKNLASGTPFMHPVIHGKGWWHKKNNRPEKSSGNEPPPVLIIGKTGTLGRAYAKICKSRGITYKLLNRQELNISNNNEIKEALLKYQPWAVINTAGFVKVDEAESQAEACYSSNFEGPVLLAHACKQYGIQLMTFSSDLVFDGKKDQPYSESDVVTPLNIYGRSKADMERSIIEILPASLVIRTSSFFGPWDNYNFVKKVIDSLSSNEILTVADDVVTSPTYIPDLVNVSLDLLIDNEGGIWHLTNKGETSWASFANRIAQHAGLDSSLLEARPAEKMGWTAVRPRYSVLKSERGILMPSLTNAISRYFEDTRMINEPINVETK
jgi:dTDP-4-dehydrorhamnose reductase